MRFWKPEDIFTMPCPFCRAEIEFWKDEPIRLCASCKNEVRNPKLDVGCAEWCKHSSDCLGTSSGGQPAPPSGEQTEAKSPGKNVPL
jgi:hypothetical protein